MKPYQAVGYKMLQATSVTSIVSTRVYHGLRPAGDTLPAINYFELGGGTRTFGIEYQPFSINCRAATAGAARNLARAVVTLFAGDDGTGTYGTQNGFSVARASLGADQGLVPEPEEGVYNAPVDITLVYDVDTIS